MSRVLVLDTGTQGYITVKSLKKAGHDVYLLYHGKHNYADDSKYIDWKYEPLVTYDDPEYLELTKKVILEKKIDAIIPMSDMGSMFLSKNKNELTKLVKYVLPNIDVFERGYDKNSLMSICREKNYNHPHTINDVTDVDGISEKQLTFPMLIKPNHTCGARGMTLVRNYTELKENFVRIFDQYGPCHLQEYIPQGGAQVEVQLYINEQQNLVASSVIYKYRWYPENGGSSCCATSIKNDEVVNMCYRLLKDIGWVGFADFDLIEDPRDGLLKIMELNPRIPACVKAAIVSGINWPCIIIDEYTGKTYKKQEFKSGVLLKHLGLETLWFFYSKNRFKSKPSFWKIFGRNIYYQDLDICDPLPFIKGSWHNIKQQLNPEFRKSKSGTR